MSGNSNSRHIKKVATTAAIASLSLVFIMSGYGHAYSQIPEMPAIEEIPEFPLMPEEISGKYISPEFGLEIIFPAGWNGTELAFGGMTMVMMSKTNASLTEDAFMGSSIMLTAAYAPTFNDTQEAEEFLPQGQQTLPEEYLEPQIECNIISQNEIMINGTITGTETVTECTMEGMTHMTKTVGTNLEQPGQVSLMYMAPVAEYDNDIAAFDRSVQTLRIGNATVAGDPSGIPTQP
jgi:hypothetical protein